MTLMNDTGSFCANFWTDFQKTIFAIPTSLLEIAFASKGGSAFNMATYYETLSVEDLINLAKTECNVSFLSGCNKKYLLAPTGERMKRMGTNQCIRHKNHIVFDLDFKDNIPNYQSLNKDSQIKAVIEFVDIVRSKIFSEELPIWFVNFTGNGLHFYLKLLYPIETHQQSEYKELYQSISDSLSASFGGVVFDPACCNTARLIRMPGSVNWKNIADPIQCQLIYYKEGIFADDLVSSFSQKKSIALAKTFQGKEEILRRLDLLKVLQFFEYKKLDSIYETSDKIICSSPMAQDKTPSFHYDKIKQLFYDFSLAKGGDLFDLIALQSGIDIKKDFPKVLQYAKKIAGMLEENSEAVNQGRYELKNYGVWFTSHSSENASEISTRICSYVDVIALCRNIHGKGWSKILLIIDKEGREKIWPMPMDMLAGDGLELRKNLLDLGADICPTKAARNHLLVYLNEKNPPKFFRNIEHLGWVGDSFVLPEKIYEKLGSDSSNVVLSNPSYFSKFSTLGSLEGWKKNIERYASSNPILQLSLSTSFAAPLLYLSGDDNFGFHLVGASSIGKTITLDVAGSVWGGGGMRGYKTRWRSTLNGLEGLAHRHNDSLLVLDELAEIAPKAASGAAYMLANGAGKVRGGKEGGIQEQLEWRTIFLSAGEIDLSTHLESDGQKTRAGQEVRMINLQASRSKNYGIFNEIHNFASSVVFVDHLRFAAQNYYGSPIRVFIEKLQKMTDVSLEIKKRKEIFKNFAGKRASQGQIARVLEKFALVFAAGSLAVDFGILDFSSMELMKSLEIFLIEWIEINGSEMLEEEVMLSQIRMYLQTYGMSRFPEINGSMINQDPNVCSGFKKSLPHQSYEWLILADVFKREICKGFNFKSVVNFLKNREILNLDKNGNAYQTIRVPSFGLARVYSLKEKIFEPVTKIL